MSLIRVVIVDDHALVREGTRQVLEADPGLKVVGEAGSAGEGVRQVVELKPDVVLLDLALPDLSGIEAARQIRALAPDTKVIVLSAYDDEDYIVAAMEVGAAGFLLKTVRGREVVEAIHGAQQGEIVLHPTIVAKLRHSLQRGKEDGHPQELSARELEILRLVGRGLRDKEIAESLQISRRTVEGHLSRILGKLGVSSRTEAVVYGASHHWLTLDDPA